jgi:hypothetical protein
MVLCLTLTLTGCAAVYNMPMTTGFIYTDTTMPMAVTDASGSSKVGTGVAVSILGFVTTGDASVQSAAKSAGITEIHHVDVKARSILGLWAEITVYVYGN